MELSSHAGFYQLALGVVPPGVPPNKAPHCPLSMTELPKGFWLVLAYLVGVVMGVIGVNLLSHKPSHSRRQPVEHCILVDSAPDYRDIQCPSGEWRYIGDTLRIRLHT